MYRLLTRRDYDRGFFCHRNVMYILYAYDGIGVFVYGRFMEEES